MFTDQPEVFNKQVLNILSDCDNGLIPTNPLTRARQVATDANGGHFLEEKKSEAREERDLSDEDLKFNLSELEMSAEETENFFLLNNLSLSNLWKSFNLFRLNAFNLL